MLNSAVWRTSPGWPIFPPPVPTSASLPPSHRGAPCHHFLLSVLLCWLWASGTWWEMPWVPRFAYTGLATTPTWSLDPDARHSVCWWCRSNTPFSSFVCIVMFKPSHRAEHSVLAVVPRGKLTKNTKHIPFCCFLSTYRLSFYCISSYLKHILLF